MVDTGVRCACEGKKVRRSCTHLARSLVHTVRYELVARASKHCRWHAALTAIPILVEPTLSLARHAGSARFGGRFGSAFDNITDDRPQAECNLEPVLVRWHC